MQIINAWKISSVYREMGKRVNMSFWLRWWLKRRFAAVFATVRSVLSFNQASFAGNTASLKVEMTSAQPLSLGRKRTFEMGQLTSIGSKKSLAYCKVSCVVTSHTYIDLRVIAAFTSVIFARSSSHGMLSSHWVYSLTVWSLRSLHY